MADHGRGTESFKLVLGALSGSGAGFVVAGRAAGIATIGAHGQSAGAKPAININDPLVRESDGYAEFVISLSAPASSQVSVDYGTADGTAGYGHPSNDFLSTNGRLVFAPGVTTQVIRVAVKTDALAEGNETFSLKLSNAINGTVTKSAGVATLIDTTG